MSTIDLPAPLAGLPFIHWVEVRFRDLDMLGHVNNAVYATYIESARIAYYQHLTGKPLEQLDMILAEITLSYRAPAVFGDVLGVGVRVTSIGTKSFAMEYTIARRGDGALIANGRSVLVAFDYASNRSVPVGDSFRSRVAEVQGGAA